MMSFYDGLSKNQQSVKIYRQKSVWGAEICFPKLKTIGIFEVSPEAFEAARETLECHCCDQGDSFSIWHAKGGRSN